LWKEETSSRGLRQGQLKGVDNPGGTPGDDGIGRGGGYEIK